ncbi:hypothetical protein W054_01047, partial [Mycobacterium tuberculosis TB_RSA144]
ALAGGTELALAADLIVAARDSAFGIPEVKRGRRDCVIPVEQARSFVERLRAVSRSQVVHQMVATCPSR